MRAPYANLVAWRLAKALVSDTLECVVIRRAIARAQVLNGFPQHFAIAGQGCEYLNSRYGSVSLSGRVESYNADAVTRSKRIDKTVRCLANQNYVFSGRPRRIKQQRNFKWSLGRSKVSDGLWSTILNE